MSQRLPEIERPNNPEEPRRERFSYYKALKDLKDVNKRVSVIKNRLNFLLYKQHQAENPTASYFEDRQIRLRTLANEDQSKIREELSLKRLKSHSEVEFKRKSNELRKKETCEKIGKARKQLVEQKFKCHDQIREKSRQNLQDIEYFKKSFLMEKQSRRRLLYDNEKKQREMVENVQLKKIHEVRLETEAQTKQIYQKIQLKEQEYREIELQCDGFERSQREKLMQHREQKFEKMKRNRRVFALDSRSTVYIQDKKPYSPSTSPHSYLSFVVLS